MPIIQYTAQLDFTDNGTFETGWRIKQGDYGESEIILRVVNNGVDMYDADITPEIVFRRADGASVISTMTPNDGTYKYTFVGNELAVPGSTLVDVKYTDSESRISTASCRFTVIEDTIGYDPTGAHTYDNPVSELVETATAAAETSINSAFIAEGYAVGTQGGEPVGRTSEYYHNNSKFYRDEASALADAFTSKAVETETGSFKSLTGGKLESCIVDIEPIQDLHGYNNPWIGGSGKNKLQNTRTGTTEQHGLKITSNEDGSVLFHAGYTANAVSAYDLSTTQDIPNGSYILNGCPSGGGGSTFQLSVNDKADTGLSNTFNDFGSGVPVRVF